MQGPLFRIAAAAFLLISGCAGPPSARIDSSPALGVWNGQHASLTLTDSGGTIEYDCGHGGIPLPLRVDAQGRFDVPGVHVREHGGPVREGEVLDSIAARYVGRVRGDEMSLRVFAGADTLGPFTLRRGAASQLIKCL